MKPSLFIATPMYGGLCYGTYLDDIDIICGVYPKKEINWAGVKFAIDKKVPEHQLKYFTGEYVVNLVNETDLVPTDKPFEVKHGGTGFMLIKREVFEKLKDKCPSYIHNMNDTNDNSDLGDKITEYFATSIDENNHLLSEDYHFCKLARDNGIKVHGAAWTQLVHTGTYQYSGRLV